MIYAVSFIDLKGRPILSRTYHDDITSSHIESFYNLLNNMQNPFPILFSSSFNLYYSYLLHSDIYLVIISKGNSNAMTNVYFLHKLVKLLSDYFDQVDEESIKDNFVLVYELLDEIVDFGFVQTMESQVLQSFILQSGLKKIISMSQEDLDDGASGRLPVSMSTGSTPWRADGIKHRKNEVFLDVVERLDSLMSSNGSILRADIHGKIMARSKLSGMPDLKLGLNDKILFEKTGKTCKTMVVELEDVKFHQCVRLQKFESDRTISFIPPDGDFELISYRLSTPPSFIMPILVEGNIEKWTRSRLEILVKIKCNLKPNFNAHGATLVSVAIPVPTDVDTPVFKSTIGGASLHADISKIIWNIGYLPSHPTKEHNLRIKLGFPSVREEEKVKKLSAPISLSFEIPYYTLTGLQVRYLRVMERSGYTALPWVRYITENGECLFKV